VRVRSISLVIGVRSGAANELHPAHGLARAAFQFQWVPVGSVVIASHRMEYTRRFEAARIKASAQEIMFARDAGPETIGDSST
jgi:hypothetical protein